MIFFATNRFSASIKKLLSKDKNYGCILSNLYSEFYPKTDDELFETGFNLSKQNPVSRFLKVRIKSCNRNAKSEGFRAIVVVNKKENKYYLLDIYPKTGPFNKSNMKKAERKECLEELKDEKAKHLFRVNFDEKAKKIVINKT